MLSLKKPLTLSHSRCPKLWPKSPAGCPGLSGHWTTIWQIHCFGWAGNTVPNRQCFGMPLEPSEAHPIPGLLAFTIFLGVACCQILGDQNTVPVRPTVSPFGLGESRWLCGERAPPWKRNPVCSLLSARTPGVQASAVTRLPHCTHGKVGFVRTSFSSWKLYAKTQNWGFPQRSEMVSEANYSIFCKGQHTLESCGNTSTSTLSASLRSAAGWKASTGTGSPGKCIFRFPFAKDYTCLLINP